MKTDTVLVQLPLNFRVEEWGILFTIFSNFLLFRQ